MLSVYRDYGVVPREGRDDNYNKPGEDPNAYRVVRRGDLVLNKMKTWQGSLGISGYDGLVSPAYFVARPLTDDSPAFLHHLLRSSPLIAEYGARSKGIRPSQWDLPWEEFQNITVDLPAVKTQRTIADFLGRETARIDALIAAKQRMVELLQEQEQRRLLQVVGDWRSAATWSLRQSGTAVFTGPFGTQLAAAEYVQDGTPLINPTHITANGELVPDRNVTVSSLVAARLARHRLDIVLGRKGDVGKSAVIAPDQDGWLCGSDAIAVRSNPARLNPSFLAVVLHVSIYRQQLEAASTGAMLTNLNEGTLLDFRLPLVELPFQERVLETARKVRAAKTEMENCLKRSIELLKERRQALITAAVAGQLDIPEAA
jgi:type I restriction enzyme S subunit